MEFSIQIVFSVIMAVLISLIFFTSKIQSGEAFSFTKMGRTVLVGIALGITAYFSGFNLTVENWEMYAAANTGAIAVVDKILTTVMKLIKPKAA